MPLRKYEVGGPSEVLGHSPGTTFEADLSPAQELLVDGGALRPIDEKPAAAPPESPEELEVCSQCGKEYPKPVENNHSEEECLANQAEAAAKSPDTSTQVGSEKKGK